MQEHFTFSRLPSRRLMNLLGFAVCALSLGVAYVLQFIMELEPCNLCIFQRLAMAPLGIAFLLAALHDPGGRGSRIYGSLIGLIAGIGAAIAARHVWIQNLPEDQVPACGPSLDYMLEVFTLGETIRKVLTGSGDCAEVQWTFLGLSIPGWTLVAFLFLGIVGFVRNWMRD
jgi:disulfide bond formation protein DsbB